MVRTEGQLSCFLQETGGLPPPALSLPFTPGLLRVPGLRMVEEKCTTGTGVPICTWRRGWGRSWGAQGVLVYSIKPSSARTFLWTKAFTLETPSVFLPIIMITEHVIPFLLFFFLHLICHQGTVFFAPLATLPLPAPAISGKHTQAHMAFTMRDPSKKGKKKDQKVTSIADVK